MKEYQRAAIEGMKRMHGDMMKGVTKNDPDVAFICEMIAHHQGAIDMSKIELKHGNNGKAKAMARQVIKAQTREIKEMKSWLKKNL